jgi:hypothetical protein
MLARARGDTVARPGLLARDPGRMVIGTTSDATNRIPGPGPATRDRRRRPALNLWE